MESIFRIWSDSFADGQRIPEAFAFEKIDPSGEHKTLPASNRNPQICWSTPPHGTRSLVLICEDFDVPADFSPANRDGVTIPADAPRTSFVHWVLVDILPDMGRIDAGTLSKGTVSRGKHGPACANGMRQGLNDYTFAFQDDPAMSGKWFGYDGPCPPWNDMRVHNYQFTLFAVDFDLLPLEGAFDARDVKKCLEGHVLASAVLTGTYTLNQALKS